MCNFRNPVILNTVKDLLHHNDKILLRQLADHNDNKKIAIWFAGLIFFGIMLSASVHAQNLGQQPCTSDRHGYCAKIVVPKDYRPDGRVKTGSQLAALNVVPDRIRGLEFLPLPMAASLGDLLAAIYYFLLSIVGISALVMFVWGGIGYMLAGDKDPSKAKERMKNAVYGLVLALTSYLILYTINPDLVSPLNVNLDPITPQQRTDGGPPADNQIPQ